MTNQLPLEDIIRIEGVEYERCPRWKYDSTDCLVEACPKEFAGQDSCFRPKRKQTGWVCHRDDDECCDDPCVSMSCVRPRQCPHDEEFEGNWQPFYGKVVE